MPRRQPGEGGGRTDAAPWCETRQPALKSGPRGAIEGVGAAELHKRLGRGRSPHLRPTGCVPSWVPSRPPQHAYTRTPAHTRIHLSLRGVCGAGSSASLSGCFTWAAPLYGEHLFLENLTIVQGSKTNRWPVLKARMFASLHF